MSEPVNWRVGTIGEIAYANPENLSVLVDPTWRFRYIDLSSAKRGHIDWASTSDLTLAHAPSRARRLVAGQDVLFGTVRPALQSHGFMSGYPDEPLVASTGFTVLRAKEGTDPKYLFHVIMSGAILADARRFEVGSNYPAVKESDVLQFATLIPPFAEQRRIGEILDAADEAIRSTERLIAKLDQIHAGLLYDLLVRGIDESGGLRDLARERAFVLSRIGRIPVSWNIRSIADLSSGSRGSLTIGPFGSDLVATDYQKSGVPVIFVRDVQAGKFSWVSNVYVSEQKASELSAHAVSPGELVITKMGLPPAIAAVYPSEMPRGIVTADIIRLAPNDKFVNPSWLSLAINSSPTRLQVASITGGVTRPKITLRDFRKILIAVPPMREQEEICNRLGVLVSRLAVAHQERSKLVLLKMGLVDDLLTGRVRVGALV